MKLVIGLIALASAGCASANDATEVDAGPGAIDASAEADAAAVVDGGGDDVAADAMVDAVIGDAGTDGAASARQWRLDTAAELAVAGHALSQVSIDSRGAIEPFAYYTGGLLVRGADTDVIVDPATTRWEDVATFGSLTARVGLVRGTQLDWGGATPAGVGLGDGENWTVAIEGEVFLEVGAWSFTLVPDDVGFVEIARPGEGFERVVSATWPNTVTGDFGVTRTGWHALRWTNSDIGGNASTVVRFAGPGVPTAIPIPRDRLRARVDHLRGLAHTGFDDELMLGPSQSTIDTTSLADISYGSGQPADLGITAADDFSSRWSGQLRIDVAGSYAFRYVSDDGHRLFVDGAVRTPATAWGETSQDLTTDAIALDVGWHDLVIDHSEHASQSQARLTVASGPELAGAALPLARLRPVEGRGERFETAVNPADVGLPARGSDETAVALTAAAAATAGWFEVSFQFRHPAPAELTFILISPDGQSTVLRDRVAGGSGSISQRVVGAFASAPRVAGTWTLRASDAADGNAGTLEDFALTIHYASGGTPPVPILASYLSPVRDLGAVTAIDGVTWGERRPAGSDVVVSMRTGATEAACLAAAWSATMTEPAGSTPAVAAGRFAQLRVELLSNGDRSSSLEWIQVDYRAQP